MLEEVSKTLLVVILLNSTYIVVDVEARLTLGLLVVADVIGKAVVELTYAHCGIHRKRSHRILSIDTRHTNHKCYECEK